MQSTYHKIVRQNLQQLFANPHLDLENTLPSVRKGDVFAFQAFGRECRLGSREILLDGSPQTGVIGILISLYALQGSPEPCVMEPLKAFKAFPNSMPYAGAFTSHTEHILVPQVPQIRARKERIMQRLKGCETPAEVGGDVSFWVYPLPKIALCYIFYEADEDFPASATCLFSGNADRFMPIDGLADVGEYTSRTLLEIIGSPSNQF